MDAVTYSLTKEQIRSYHQNGYLVVENVLSFKECDTLLQICEKYADENYSAILNLDRRVPELRNLMKDPRLVAMLEAIEGEVVGVMSQVLFKKVASPYASQAWNPHQDNSYPQVEGGVYITINAYLADSDPENGGIYMFPGSHKEGLFPCMPTVSYREVPGTNPGNTVQVPEKFKSVDLYTRKGDVLFIHGHVIHGSYPNHSRTRSRPLLQLCYVTKGAKFIPGKNANRTVIDLK